MELRKGYKKTDIGTIPTQWSVKLLADITSMLTNGFVGTIKAHYTEDEVGVLYIQGYNVEENTFNLHGIKYVSQEFHKQHLKSCLEEGDLLTIQTGDIGVSAVVPKELEGANCHALIITRFKPNTSDARYFSYYFNYPVGRAFLKAIETGSTMKHINVGDMIHLRVPFPPLPEQTAIATALSDTDALIRSLENLITKKRNIKQGAMQELLTGKKRLPGFKSKWGSIKLGEIGGTYGGLSGKSKADFQAGKYPYIPFMNIMKNPVIDLQYLDYVNVHPQEHQNKALLGDLFFNGSSETPEEVGMCSVLHSELPCLFLNSFCFGFRLKAESEADGLFLAYYFRSSLGRELMFSSAQGATRYNLSKSNFIRLEIPFPELDEQSAIANTLKEMDSEIFGLESKLEKCKLLKQGMMQELLTGKTRLV